MTDAEQWPPRSPLKTLLSSPSGRKRYQDYQTSSLAAISPNKLLGSPSLLEKLRAARADRDADFLEPQKVQEENSEEEDEEILQLKLQAIEAKLKLKKLRQQKAKDAGSVRPQSSSSSATQSGTFSSKVEVALSPTKRITPSIPKSPSRVVLGIDKGVSAADISLKRPRTVNVISSSQRTHHVESRFSRPSSTMQTSRSVNFTDTPVKSFSERMANMRGMEKDKEEKRFATHNARSAGFKLNQSEIESYHNAAGLPSTIESKQSDKKRQQPTSILKSGMSREAPISGRDDQAPAPSRSLKHSKSMPSIRSSSPSKNAPLADSTEESKGDATLYEPFSNTHLSSRILPHTFLKRTLPSDQFEVFTLPRLLKTVTSPSYQMPDEIMDYVVFGIIASKSTPRDHKARTTDTNTTSSKDWEKKWNDGSMNNSKFMVMTLTDLKWTIDLFLFDTAVPRYHRLTPGTLIAILNPSIMPPKKGREDTGAFSLSLHNGEDQILEIGKAKHLSYCVAKRKDGKPCGSWVDGSKTEICEWHLNAELDRARSKRMGVNSMGGTNGSKRNGEKNFKHGFDYEAQSFYYAVGGSAPKKQGDVQWSYAPTYNPSLSTAKLLDSTNPDDPFVASGQLLERDKQDRLRKKMVAQEKEREIARKLGGLGHKGGAGGEYFRKRTGDSSNTPKNPKNVTSGPGITVDDIMRDKAGESKKRAAGSVRLSPVKKKTRFLTSTGIKEAGRESLGPGSGKDVGLAVLNARDEFDDDDDDLDIV